MKTTEEFVQVIQAAKDQGMVPLVIVMPVTPEALIKTRAEDICADAAAKAARQIVKDWRRDNVHE